MMRGRHHQGCKGKGGVPRLRYRGTLKPARKMANRTPWNFCEFEAMTYEAWRNSRPKISRAPLSRSRVTVDARVNAWVISLSLGPQVVPCCSWTNINIHALPARERLSQISPIAQRLNSMSLRSAYTTSHAPHSTSMPSWRYLTASARVDPDETVLSASPQP
ncbi:hypothetical protein BDN71DRAFT_703398 [Pleurotus eryngii]|uniref:Uncharacterized protein n=1 Tax=Pleurotus eryngii TaxID=5323 RepID=A0A9P6A8X8_PLEER|nr:hypothetical protein BDN71DRAFT_703398 [Pleurotus eryngii]